MEALVEGLVHVHVSMQQILPCVDEQKGHKDLEQRPSIHVDQIAQLEWDQWELFVEEPCLVLFITGVLHLIKEGSGVAHDRLDDMLEQDISQDVHSGSLISGCDFLWWMDSVLLSQLEGVNDMEEQRIGPIGHDGGHQCKHVVRDSINKRRLLDELVGRHSGVHCGSLQRWVVTVVGASKPKGTHAKDRQEGGGKARILSHSSCTTEQKRRQWKQEEQILQSVGGQSQSGGARDVFVLLFWRAHWSEQMST